jgi:hypothetical protein
MAQPAMALPMIALPFVPRSIQRLPWAEMSAAATGCTAHDDIQYTGQKCPWTKRLRLKKSLRVNCSKWQIQLPIRESPAQDDA